VPPAPVGASGYRHEDFPARGTGGIRRGYDVPLDVSRKRARARRPHRAGFRSGTTRKSHHSRGGKFRLPYLSRQAGDKILRDVRYEDPLPWRKHGGCAGLLQQVRE
jgi:hypothetical protein